jgi:hypothetical protein
MKKTEMRRIRRELISDCLLTKWYTGTAYSLITIKIFVRYSERVIHGQELKAYA